MDDVIRKENSTTKRALAVTKAAVMQAQHTQAERQDRQTDKGSLLRVPGD